MSEGGLDPHGNRHINHGDRVLVPVNLMTAPHTRVARYLTRFECGFVTCGCDRLESKPCRIIPLIKTELLIMRYPHYGRMCFKSVKTLGALHFQLWKKPRPPASAFSTAKNVDLLGFYPIRSACSCTALQTVHLPAVCSVDLL